MKNEILSFVTDVYNNGENEREKVAFVEVGVPKDEGGEYDRYYLLTDMESGEPLCDDFFEAYGKFSDDVAPICKFGKWGYIKKSGAILIPTIYAEVDESVNNVLCMIRSDNERVELRSAVDGKCLGADDGFVAVCPYGGQKDAKCYIVRQDNVSVDGQRLGSDLFGVIDCDGKWLIELTQCADIYKLTNHLAYVSYCDCSGEIRDISSGEVVVFGKYFEFGYWNSYGICWCRDEKHRIATYRWIEEDDCVSCLFCEFGENIVVRSPNVVELFNGEKMLYYMFSIPKKQWIQSDLTKIKALGSEDATVCYVIDKNGYIGITDEFGEILIPIELQSWYRKLNVLMVRNYAGWGAYDLLEKKWLFLPQAYAVRALNIEKSYGLLQNQESTFRNKKFWRYCVNGKLFKGEYLTCNEFLCEDDVVKAEAMRVDGTEGWLFSDGTFVAKEKKGFFDRFKRRG